jgi:integrase
MATIRKRGVKWQVQVRRVGLRPISRSFHIRKDAELWARQMEVEADRCGLPRDPKALQRVTLRELVERYRDSVSVRKRGYEIERIVLNAFLRQPLCQKRLSDIRTENFASYRDQRLNEIKPSSLKRQLCSLQNMFEIARDEWGMPIRENPLSKLKIAINEERRERRLEPGEYEALTDAARRSRNNLVLPIIQLAIETGMRRGELLRARWSHFSLADRSLSIPETKNGYSRTIPLTPLAVQIITQLKKGISNDRESGEKEMACEDFLFPTSPNALRLNWERIRKRAKVGNLRFHDLRHEAISRFFEIGLTAPDALMSGHRGIRTLSRYAHPMRQANIEKAAQWRSRDDLSWLEPQSSPYWKPEWPPSAPTQDSLMCTPGRSIRK